MSRDIAALKAFLRERVDGGIALAFSGGVDSTLLLSVLKELQDEAPFPLLALTMHSVFQQENELDEAMRLAKQLGVELKVVHSDLLSIPEVKYNPPDRCYWCKRYIFNEFWTAMKALGIATLVDGSNADDRKVYRPGRRALKELQVLSPLDVLGFSKSTIRELAQARGLSTASKPSMPCLATRFEYGALLSAERLEQVGRGEELIRSYVPATADVRLRVHANIARIEVSPDAMEGIMKHAGEIAPELHKLGFSFITLDLEGFRSGCFDQTNHTTLEV